MLDEITDADKRKVIRLLRSIRSMDDCKAISTADHVLILRALHEADPIGFDITVDQVAVDLGYGDRKGMVEALQRRARAH
jgi:hypothetical protein